MLKMNRSAKTGKFVSWTYAKKLPRTTVSERRKTEGTGNSHEEGTSARKIAIAACQLPSQPCSRESERCSSQSDLAVAVSAAKVVERRFQHESKPSVVSASRVVVTVNCFLRCHW